MIPNSIRHQNHQLIRGGVDGGLLVVFGDEKREGAFIDE
jgi:hypothetical protein